MKKNYAPVALLAAIATTFTMVGFTAKNKAPKNVASTNGFAVVELFTSEGCSSCPSADETVARLLSKNISNVYILAYHVDYWNRLGWKDPFSSAAYSQRQSQYASAFGLSSVYTPQVVVNGSTEFVGSDEDKLINTIESDLKKETGRHLNIAAKRTDNLVTLDYDVDDDNVVLLNLALVQPEATTSVKRGENGGRILHHVNIVRMLKTIDAKGRNNVTMEIPKELTGIPLKIIAYTQEKKSFQILSAVQNTL